MPPISDKTTAADPDKCTKDQLGTLYPGILTFGTDQPVYPPWYLGDNPASGEGGSRRQSPTPSRPR